MMLSDDKIIKLAKMLGKTAYKYDKFELDNEIFLDEDGHISTGIYDIGKVIKIKYGVEKYNLFMKTKFIEYKSLDVDNEFDYGDIDDYE